MLSDACVVPELQNGAAADCCQGDDHCQSNPQSPGKIDGAGEPCPTPLMWQEVLESYLRDSRAWEVQCGQHRLFGRTWGQGPPLYFLNNFAATAEMFSLLLWLLRDTYRCIVFDPMTSDVKTALQSRPTMRNFAADLFAVADANQDRRFAVYGAGFGAAVAMQAALDQPDRVERLILQHGFARRPLSLSERLLASLCLRSGRSLKDLPQRVRFQSVNHRPWFPPFDPSRFDFLIESSGTLPLRDLARRALAVHSFDIVSQLDQISCSVMLLRTEGEGRQAAVAQDSLEKSLKSSRVEWMHSAGQHPCLTHPHRVAKLIQSFCPAEPPQAVRQELPLHEQTGTAPGVEFPVPQKVK